jgi:hypothetical protein
MSPAEWKELKRDIDRALGRVSQMHVEVIDDRSAEYFRRMTGQQRLKIADEMFAFARATLLHHLRREHPDWTQEQVEAETARRISHGAL